MFPWPLESNVYVLGQDEAEKSNIVPRHFEEGATNNNNNNDMWTELTTPKLPTTLAGKVKYVIETCWDNFACFI